MNRKHHCIIILFFCLFLAYIPFSVSFPDLKVGFTDSLDKVFFEEPIEFEGEFVNHSDIYLAKNEYEAVQFVIFPDKDLEDVEVSVSDFSSGQYMIPSSDVSIDLVGYVSLSDSRFDENRAGWYPDPLLPNHLINISADVLQPFLITAHTRDTTHPGEYIGKIILDINGSRSYEYNLTIHVWNFTLPMVSRFKTATFFSWDTIFYMWRDWEKRSRQEAKDVFYDIAELSFRNKLQPVIGMVSGYQCWKNNVYLNYPTYDEDDNLDLSLAEEFIDFFIEHGANNFYVATLCDMVTYPATKEHLTEYLEEYETYLDSRGILDMAYIYNLDEPWGDSVNHCKYNYDYIKNITGIRVMQNTNRNDNTVLSDFLGYFDSIDINLGFHDINDMSSYRENYSDQFTDVWWNINVWPDTHPNLFLEYPLIDARIIGPMSYKYDIDGFEYWQLFTSSHLGNYYYIEDDDLRVDWQVDSRSLDGVLIYPGRPYEKVYSSLRFESFRDGMEDLEYLYILEQVDPDNDLLDVDVVSDLSDYTGPDEYLNYRKLLSEAITGNFISCADAGGSCLSGSCAPDYDSCSFKAGFCDTGLNCCAGVCSEKKKCLMFEDEPCDGCYEQYEITNLLSLWVDGSVSVYDLIDAIVLWKDNICN